MYRLINILRINCAPSWFYIQDYTGMHGQQNIKRKQGGLTIRDVLVSRQRQRVFPDDVLARCEAQ
jgi:hypothetical protein